AGDDFELWLQPTTDAPARDISNGTATTSLKELLTARLPSAPGFDTANGNPTRRATSHIVRTCRSYFRRRLLAGRRTTLDGVACRVPSRPRPPGRRRRPRGRSGAWTRCRSRAPRSRRVRGLPP